MKNPSSDSGSRLVYTSDSGRMCPECGQAAKECLCRKKAPAPRSGSGSGSAPVSAQSKPGTGGARVRREVGGRGGKTVTTISDLGWSEERLKTLAGQLKKKLGTGGSIKNGVIEIQGDHREAIMAELAAQGIPAKKAGG